MDLFPNAVWNGKVLCPGLVSIDSGHWMVLVDAAKGSATCPLDLSKYKADFVVVSFYKVVMQYFSTFSWGCREPHFNFFPPAIWLPDRNWSSYCSKR